MLSRRALLAATNSVGAPPVLHLDAGNTASYPGTGSTWYDLSGYGNSVNFVNSPVWDSRGFFTTDPGYFTGTGSASIPQGNSSYTLICWIRFGTWQARKGIISIGGSGSSNQSNALRTGDTASLVHLLHYWWANDLAISNNNAGVASGDWMMVAAQFDGTTRRVWVNNVNVGSDNPGSSHNVTSTAIQVGSTPGAGIFPGSIIAAFIYNRALSASELAQSFSALSARASAISNGVLLMYLDAGNTASYSGTGTSWNDLSGNGRNGTISNGSYNALDGGSVVFNGTSTGVDYGLIAISDFTCEVWVNLGSTAGGLAFGGGISGADNNQLQLSDGIGIALGDSQLSVTPGTTGALTTGTWCQVVWARVGEAISIYKNGSFLASASSSAQLRISKIGTNGGGFLSGRISVARVYAGALSAAEISANFNALRGRYGI